MDNQFTKIISADKNAAVDSKAAINPAMAANPNAAFPDNLLVFERNENSDLVQCSCTFTSDLFKKIFGIGGPYWNTYANLGFGAMPYVPYAHFFGGRMYFLKNLEQRNIFGTGPVKSFEFKNGKIAANMKIDIDSTLLLFCAPFDFARLSCAASLLALNTPLYFEEFEKFRSESQDFLKMNVNLKNFDKGVFEAAIKGAMHALDFSFFATLSYSLNLKFPPSSAWAYCEAEELAKMLEKSQEKTHEKMLGKTHENEYARNNTSFGMEIAKQFAYYSPDIYDISVPRISESFPQRLAIIAPQNPQMRLRENAKFCLGKYLFILRRQMLLLGRQHGLGDLVFHMKIDEVLKLAESGVAGSTSVAGSTGPAGSTSVGGSTGPAGASRMGGLDSMELRSILERRKAEFDAMSSLASSEFPARFIYDRKTSSWLEEKTSFVRETAALNAKNAMISTEAQAGKSNPVLFFGIGVGGAGIASGEAVFISSRADYSKSTKGKIILSDTFSPDLATICKGSLGVVSKVGGRLAHSAIIAREMNIPCIVQVSEFERIKEGQAIEIDGKKGQIRILE